MENPFFRNRLGYQKPDRTRSTSSHSPSIRGVPVYSVDPIHETHRPDYIVQCPRKRNLGTRVVRIPVHFVGSERVDRIGSAVKIQKVFRGYLVRKCLKKIKDIKVQVAEIEEQFLKSEILDLVRRDERERLRLNETLMSLLLKLDSICGVDFGVRGCRKAVIRKVIALQERIDANVAADLVGNGENDDRVTEIGVYVETEDKSDHQVNPTGTSENSGGLEGFVECGENLENAGCVQGNDKSMVVEVNDGEAEIIDVGVDWEVKVSESNGENVDLVVKGVKESSSEGDDKVNNDTRVNVDEEGNGVDDNKRNRELLEKMMEESEKMMSLMTQLYERNEMQTKMLNALTHRVELLEKAFVCDKLRRKKKTKTNATATCKEN